MEAKIEDLAIQGLEIRGMAVQIDTINKRLKAIEASHQVRTPLEKVAPALSSSASSIQIEIVLERLKRVEESLDRRKPPVNFPFPSVDEVLQRLDDVESCSTRLAEDTLAAVQGVHEELAGLRTDFIEVVEKRTGQVEERLETMLSEGIEKISVVLRKLVAVQKSLSSARTR